MYLIKNVVLPSVVGLLVVGLLVFGSVASYRSVNAQVEETPELVVIAIPKDQIHPLAVAAFEYDRDTAIMLISEVVTQEQRSEILQRFDELFTSQAFHSIQTAVDQDQESPHFLPAIKGINYLKTVHGL